VGVKLIPHDTLTKKVLSLNRKLVGGIVGGPHAHTAMPSPGPGPWLGLSHRPNVKLPLYSCGTHLGSSTCEQLELLFAIFGPSSLRA
jgi:hypothetical protein